MLCFISDISRGLPFCRFDSLRGPFKGARAYHSRPQLLSGWARFASPSPASAPPRPPGSVTGRGTESAHRLTERGPRWLRDLACSASKSARERSARPRSRATRSRWKKRKLLQSSPRVPDHYQSAINRPDSMNAQLLRWKISLGICR